MNEMTRSIHDVIAEIAHSALEDQRADGSMPPGHNGPWNDPETPVRNTGHWAITFLRSYEHTGNEEFLKAGKRAISYLESEEARPHGATFHHIRSGDNLRCNGLVGQAWSIEALVVAARVLDRPDLVELASEVFLLHSFETDLVAWHPVEIDGEELPIDMTFNHQLWFAAAGGLLAQHPESDSRVYHQVKRYLDELPSNLNLIGEGLVYHPFKPEFDFGKYMKIFLEGIKAGTAHTMVIGVLQGMLGSGSSSDSNGGWTEKSIGYHSFNLYAFAMLHEAYPDHSVWDSEKIQRALNFADSEPYREGLDENLYGYPYNVSGIEIPYTMATFGRGDQDSMSLWLERQFSRTYNPAEAALAENNPDPVTLTARVYEATRLPDIEFSIETTDE